MKRLTHLSLFSGIGGLDLAAEWAGMQTIGQCEWAEYPTKVLEKHWPDVPRWKDIRTLTGESFYERTGRRTVDIISGGFPCQPFSTAGKQRGKEDDRYLWPEMVRVIKELRPTWIVGENVAGIVKMALPDILSELEACGYRTRTFLVPACAVGARHRRYRVAIVGYSEHNGLSSAEIDGGTQKTGGGEQEGKKKAGQFAGKGKPGNSQNVGRTESERTGETLANTAGERLEGTTGTKLQGKRHGFTASDKDVSDTGNSCKTLANAESQSERRLPIGEEPKKSRFSSSGEDVQYTDNRLRKRPDEKIQPGRDTAYCSGTGKRKRSAEPVLGGVADGISSGVDGNLDFIINHFWDEEPDIPRIATGIDHRCDRLKCLGNAVVPQQFYPIFNAIVQAEQTKGEWRWRD